MNALTAMSRAEPASDVLLLGAAGNSGRLIAADLAVRGLSVRLAGRNRGPLEDLARAMAAAGATTQVRRHWSCAWLTSWARCRTSCASPPPRR